MAPTEVILGTLAAITGLSSMLFGGGLFRQALNHKGEMSVQKYKQDQSDMKIKENDGAIQALTTSVALINREIKGFHDHVKKLELLPEMLAQLAGIQATMTYMKEQITELKNQHTSK